VIDEELLKWIIGQGGVIAIAVLLLHTYRKDMTHFTHLWRGQSELLMQVVKENTIAITSNTEVIRSLQDHMDHNHESRAR